MFSYTSSSIDANGTGECGCDGAGGSWSGAMLFEVLDELAVALVPCMV